VPFRVDWLFLHMSRRHKMCSRKGETSEECAYSVIVSRQPPPNSMVQWDIRSNSVIFDVLNDPISRWSIRPTPPRILANCPGNQFVVWAVARVLVVSGSRHGSFYDDSDRFKFGDSITREKLCRGLFTDSGEHLGTYIFGVLFPTA
jgi:hypothetical protein